MIFLSKIYLYKVYEKNNLKVPSSEMWWFVVCVSICITRLLNIPLYAKKVMLLLLAFYLFSIQSEACYVVLQFLLSSQLKIWEIFSSCVALLSCNLKIWIIMWFFKYKNKKKSGVQNNLHYLWK